MQNNVGKNVDDLYNASRLHKHIQRVKLSYKSECR